MVKRRIKKYGGSLSIKLEVADIMDYKLKEGQTIDVHFGDKADQISKLIANTDDFLKAMKDKDLLKEELKVELMKEVEDAVFEKLKKAEIVKPKG